ncbi:sporulation integral membrane protein YtvI [Halobacillus sp. H74]|uniref:sporulation integral membrane protein YtvI n=1 Tax=Halobacillus sp. H74 TaxID=3457436 RepID=UPI003FCC3E4F
MDNHFISSTFRFLFILLTIIGLIISLFWSWTYLYPFIIAFLLSSILQPFIQLLVKHFHFPKVLAILSVLCLFVGLIGALAVLLVAELIKGIQYLSTGVPEHFERFTAHITLQTKSIIRPLLNKIEAISQRLSVQQQQSVDEYLNLMQDKVTQTGVQFLNSAFEGLVSILTTLPSSMTAIFITLLATFFICKDWEWMKHRIMQRGPEPFLLKIHMLRVEMKNTIHGLIKAQCTLVAISTLIIGVGLFVIGASHAMTITFLVAIVDFIPYVGTGAIFLPWIIYQFFSGEFSMTISLTVLYMIVILTRQVLEPKLLANHFGVPPVLLLISLFVGFKIFGAYGMIISPIVLMVIQTLNKTGLTNDVWSFIKGN